MQEQNPNMTEKMVGKENDLAIENNRETRRRQSNSYPESISVDNDVDQGIGQYRHDLKGLCKFEPQEGHENQSGVVENPGRRKTFVGSRHDKKESL